MARDISELGADVIDDTPVDPKHRMSKKKKNYIIGLSITGFLVAGIVTGTIILANTVLADYSNIENVTYYFNTEADGTQTAVLYKLKSDKTYPSTFRIPSQVKGRTVVGVGEAAFSGHEEFRKIIMPNTITMVGEKAFYNCKNLSSITWSNKLEDLGVDALTNTKYYENISKDTKSMTYLPSGLLIYVGKDYFPAGTALVSKEMKDETVATLTTKYSLTGVNEVKVFENLGVNNISSGAFKNNEKIVFIDLPSHLRTIYNSTFESCKNLQALVGVHSGVTEIRKRAFANCTNLSHIEFPTGLTYLGDEAFENCGLTDRIPDLSVVENVGESVFANCKQLTSIVYAGPIVPDYAFKGCSQLSSIEWGEGNNNIDNVVSFGIGAFAGTGFTSFTFPKNISFVADELFQGCTALESISVYEGKFFSQELEPQYDEETGELLPDPEYYHVNLDGSDGTDNSFVGIESFRANSFKGCTSLATIKLVNENYQEITGKNEVGTFNFPITTYRTDVNSTITGNNNATFAQTAVKKVVFSPNVRAVGSYAFSKCTELETVEFLQPELTQMYNIKKNAFENCNKLANIVLPKSITTVGSSAFLNCTSLTSLNIGDLEDLSSLNSQVFAGCTQLGTVIIPENVTSIKTRAFYQNYGIEYVIVPEGIKEMHESAFEEMRQNPGETMPIYLNFTVTLSQEEKKNYKDNFCDETCTVYYLLGEGETAPKDDQGHYIYNYWKMVGDTPTPFIPE